MPKPVVVSFIGQVQRLKASVNESIGTLGRFKEKTKGIMAGVGLAIGTAAVGGAKVVLDQSKQMELATRNVRQTFKDAASDIEAWAQTTAKSFGLARIDALEASNMFGLMFQNAGKSAAEAAREAQRLTGLAADMAAATGRSMPEALEALQSALKGEFDVLDNFGVSLNEAAVSAQLAAKGQEKLTGKTAEAAKQQAIVDLLFKNTEQIKGRAAANADTLAGKQARATAQLKDQATALSVSLAPAIQKTIEAGTGLVRNINENRGAWAAVATVVGVVSAILLANAAAQKVNLAIQTVTKASTAAWTAAQWALNAAMTANPIGIVIALIAALVVGIIIAYKRSETFRNIVNGAFNAVKNAASNFWTGVKHVFNQFMDLASKVAARVRGDFNKIIDTLRSLPGRALQYGKDLISNFIAGVRAMAGALRAAILNIIPGPIADFLHLRSPAKKGPLSEDGGPEGWGRKFVDQYARGISKGSIRAPVFDLASGLAGGRAAPAGAGGGMNLTINTHTNASAADIMREAAWLMKTQGR